MPFAFTQDVPIDAETYARIRDGIGDEPPEGLIVHVGAAPPCIGAGELDRAVELLHNTWGVARSPNTMILLIAAEQRARGIHDDDLSIAGTGEIIRRGRWRTSSNANNGRGTCWTANSPDSVAPAEPPPPRRPADTRWRRRRSSRSSVGLVEHVAAIFHAWSMPWRSRG
jgi:hypothetical protein